MAQYTQTATIPKTAQRCKMAEIFGLASRYDSALTDTYFLKKDKNYYAILDDHWTNLCGKIARVFENIM